MMDIPLDETIILSSQAAERHNAFKNIGLSFLISQSAIILAPFDQTMLRKLRVSRAADAKARGGSRFQQVLASAEAPFALIDRYVGMTVAAVLAELPASRVLGAEDILRAVFTEAVRSSRSPIHATAGEPPHKFLLEISSGEISLQIDGHTSARELQRLLAAILGDRLQVE